VSAATEHTPTISVVIPTYRRHDALARCLEAIARQTLAKHEFEVIVVDDGSGNPPRAVIERVAAQLHITLLTRDNGGPGAARNTGVAAAFGTWVAFTDDDCLPEPKWLAELLHVATAHTTAHTTTHTHAHTTAHATAHTTAHATAHTTAHTTALVGGRVENALTGNVFAEASQLLTAWLRTWYSHPDRYARLTFTTNNMLFAREQFERIGGFDTTSLADTAEDRDLCDRWRAQGWPLVHAPHAVVRHAHRMSFGGFVAQHHNYGRGAVYFHRAAGRVPSQARKPETLRFYFGLLQAPFTKHNPLRAFGFSLLLLLAQVAYVGGYFSERVFPIKQVRA